MPGAIAGDVIGSVYERQRIKALDERLDDIRQVYRFDVSRQGSVPQSIIAFPESEDWEDAVPNAVSLGGDADTMAAIAGSIAETFYGGVPEAITTEVMRRLDDPLTRILGAFRDRIALAG